MPAEEFITRHGNGFLLHRGGLDRSLAGNEVSVDQTLDVEFTGTLADKTTSSTERFVVFPLPANDHHAPGPRLLSVGRMPTNEVGVDIETVSEIHALIKHDPERGFLLHDAGSRNGTYVNGDPVPKQGDGEPVALRTGSRVSLGGFHFTFLDGPTFHRLVNALFRF